jgi:hypothetical protein
MECSDTGKIEAVRLEHLDVKTADRLNSLLGILKRMFRGNARITLVINGGHIETMEPCQVIKLDDPPPKTVA